MYENNIKKELRDKGLGVLDWINMTPPSWIRWNCSSSTSSSLPAGCIVGALYHKLLTQSSASDDGRNYRPKHVELIGIINKPLLVHLVCCLCYCISDARSYKRHSNLTQYNYCIHLAERMKKWQVHLNILMNFFFCNTRAFFLAPIILSFQKRQFFMFLIRSVRYYLSTIIFKHLLTVSLSLSLSPY